MLRKSTIFYLVILLGGCNAKPTHNVDYYEDASSPTTAYIGTVELSIKDSNTNFAIWTDETFYKLYNDVFAPQGKLEDSLKLKLNNISCQKIQRSNIKFTDIISVQDSIEMFSDIDTSYYIFNCSKFNNTICISLKEHIDIFFPKGINKNNGGKMIDESWIKFQEKYGLYGLHYISIPIFNKNKTKAILIKGGAGNASIGSEEMYFLELKNNRWEIIKEIPLFII